MLLMERDGSIIDRDALGLAGSLAAAEQPESAGDAHRRIVHWFEQDAFVQLLTTTLTASMRLGSAGPVARSTAEGVGGSIVDP